jgi:putative metalloprotease
MLALLLWPTAARVQEIDRELVFRGMSEAETLWRRGYTLSDEEHDQRLQEMLAQLVEGIEIDPAVKLNVHVFRHPQLNAFALPDGSVFVFAGLLAELNTTAELAFILAHEAQHSIGWHAQKHISQAKSKSALFETLSILGSVAAMSVAPGANAMTVGLLNTFGQLGLALVAAASITGYGRDLEREADETGLVMLQRAGHSGCGSVNGIRVLAQDHDDPGRLANFFWGSHPRLLEREEYLQEAVEQECVWDPETVAGDYASIKWPMTKLTVSLWIGAEQFREALKPAQTYLERFSDDPEIHYSFGEIYRGVALADTEDPVTNQADTLALAEESYRKALDLAAEDYRAPLRGLALLAEARADTAACISYLESYLADDRRVPYRRSLRRKLHELRARFTGGEAISSRDG